MLPYDDMGRDRGCKEHEEDAKEEPDAEDPFHDEKQEGTDEGEQHPNCGALRSRVGPGVDVRQTDEPDGTQQTEDRSDQDQEYGDDFNRTCYVQRRHPSLYSAQMQACR